jgi:hypothetical protein
MPKKTAAIAEAASEESSGRPGGVVKKTFNLPKNSVEAINKLAREQSTSITEVVRKAIRIENFLYEELKNGGKLYVEFDDKTKKELVLLR